MNSGVFEKKFYSRMGFVLIAFVLLGFAPFVYQRFDAGGTWSLPLMMHSLTFLCWLVLFVYQASLVQERNMKRHMALGNASLGLAALMIVFAIMVTGEVYAKGESSATPFTPEQFLLLPVMDIAYFTIYYGCAFHMRKVPQTHKRLMLLVGIMMMEPATARLGIYLGFPPLGMILLFGLVAALWMHDRKVLGAAHRVTKVAVGALVLRYVIFFGLGPTNAWRNFLHSVLGVPGT